jgi:hypothetical protein
MVSAFQYRYKPSGSDPHDDHGCNTRFCLHSGVCRLPVAKNMQRLRVLWLLLGAGGITQEDAGAANKNPDISAAFPRAVAHRRLGLCIRSWCKSRTHRNSSSYTLIRTQRSLRRHELGLAVASFSNIAWRSCNCTQEEPQDSSSASHLA